MNGSFSRARTPAQRAARSDAILAAARELVEGKPVSEISLRAIAVGAGLAPSSVLRHGGSREQILLDLMDEEYGAWLTELKADLRIEVTGEVADVVGVADTAAAIAFSLDRRPTLMVLIENSPELLRHVSTSTRALNQGLRNQQELANIIEHAVGTELRPEDRPLLVAGLHASVAGAAAWGRQSIFLSSPMEAIRDLLSIQLDGLVVRALRGPE
ncbi:MAG: TetR family transcriptional regulator [Aeromicrobium sp.]